MAETPNPNLPRGLIRRTGTPTAGQSSRLPTIRTPRDLTLGGRQKRTFTPNIPVRREKKEEGPTEEVPSTKKKKEPREGRERGRGRGRGRGEVIQSHSVFELGPAERPGAKPGTSGEGAAFIGGGGGGRGFGGRGGRGGGRGGGGGGGGGGRGGGYKREFRDAMETKQVIDDLLKDNVVQYDLEADDPTLVPVRLPLGGPIKSETKMKAEKTEIKVKQEGGNDDDSMDGLSRETTPSPMISGHAQRERWATSCADLFSNPSKSETGEFLFIQLPDVLPGEPKTTDDRPAPASSSASTESSQDTLAERLGLCSLSDFSEGLIGKLQVRKSGRTQLLLGNVALDVAMGTPPGFLQDLVSVQTNEDSGDMTVLGHVGYKLVCTPDFEYLLNKS